MSRNECGTSVRLPVDGRETVSDWSVNRESVNDESVNQLNAVGTQLRQPVVGDKTDR